jgi:hypothetical protein
VGRPESPRVPLDVMIISSSFVMMEDLQLAGV